jgi:D-glycero-D-manno-heptose 1,7-bisphosphate phosphatase
MAFPLPPVFLDRDGVINRNRDDYVRSIADWVPIPGSIEAVARLSGAGHPVIVVTNQSAVARGYCALADVEAVHALMRTRIEEAGGSLTGVYYCPHHPDEHCICRKPEIGMIDRARAEHLLPSGGYLVGDAVSDMEMGRKAGLLTILVLTGRGAAQLLRMKSGGDPMPWKVAADLAEAVDIILGSAL